MAGLPRLPPLSVSVCEKEEASEGEKGRKKEREREAVRGKRRESGRSRVERVESRDAGKERRTREAPIEKRGNAETQATHPSTFRQ